MAGKKTTCPITREQFRTDAKAVEIVVNGIPLLAEVKEFSTGSLGWYLNRKIEIDVGGVKVPVQVGLNLTIVGSKELPQDAAPAHATPAAGHETHAAPAHEGHAAHTGHAHADHGAEHKGESHSQGS
jgi:hypothetical protein